MIKGLEIKLPNRTFIDNECSIVISIAKIENIVEKINKEIREKINFSTSEPVT